MDSFPTDFNLKTCMKAVEDIQKEVVRNVRKEFYNTVLEEIQKCSKYVKLSYPSHMWDEYRKIVTVELLNRFGVLEVETANMKYSVAVTLVADSDIPDNVTDVTVKLWN